MRAQAILTGAVTEQPSGDGTQGRAGSVLPPENTSENSWLPKQLVADILGCSIKWVQKFERDGKLQKRLQKNHNGRLVAVYHPDDVERLRQQRNKPGAPFVVPVEASTGNSLARFRNDAEAGAFLVNRATAELASLLTAQASQKQAVNVKEKLFLTIAEASEYSGLPKRVLVRMIRESRLQALRTGAGWRIRRLNLESIT